MSELVSALDALARQFPTTEQRLAVTFAAVGTLLFVLLSYRDLQERVAERTRPLYADVVSTVVLAGTTALTIAVTLGVWGQTTRVQDAYASLGLGESVLPNAILSLVIVVVAMVVSRFIRRILQELLSNATAVTDHQREVTNRLTQAVIWSVTLVAVLATWIDDLSGVIVGAGVLGVVIGMAARQTLGTMLAGFVLMFSRPFEIGDWIEIEGDEGIVTDISIFNTRIQSFDGEYVMVPNDLVGSSMVTNRSRRGRLRVEVEVGVDYDADLDRAAELAEAAIEEVEQAMDAPSPQVVAKAFGDSAIVLGVRFWIDKPSSRRRWRARTAAIGAIKRAFEAEGIKIPFPQRELSGRAETGGFRVDDGGRGPEDDRQAGVAETPAEDD
ncbi:mechanosensitive ion channel family protein [Salinilacihabitans rarus]|uniref:mechanosensitive ion channel family protein n=1 Tax=Salinilacihabitans rarus TaxID=2961596 RepID=UPI0020C9206E|nr:mechanosensitive ion channel family protein [Salinilacihabitans rarus]